MIGLAAGALAAEKLLPRVRRKERGIVLTLLAFALFCATLTRCLEAVGSQEPWFIETVLCALVLLSGLLTGLAFPLVASRHLEKAGNAGESSGWDRRGRSRWRGRRGCGPPERCWFLFWEWSAVVSCWLWPCWYLPD